MFENFNLELFFKTTLFDSKIRLQYLEVLSLPRVFFIAHKKSESHFGKVTTLTCQQLQRSIQRPG